MQVLLARELKEEVWVSVKIIHVVTFASFCHGQISYHSSS